MSLEDIDLLRHTTGSMFIYTYILLKDNVSVPAKEAALRILSVFLDQVLSKRAVQSALREAFKYMRWMGYETPDLDRVPASHDEARRMVLGYLRRGEEEDILDYYRRVGLFIARLLAYYRLTSEDVLLEMMW